MAASGQKTMQGRRLGGRLRRLGSRFRAPRPVTDKAKWPIDYAVFSENAPVQRFVSPESGTGICADLKLFHDAGGDAPLDVATRTYAGSRQLTLTMYAVAASYVSLVAGVPGNLASAIRPHHRLLVDLSAQASRPLNVYLRLNISADDTHEVLHESFILSSGEYHAGFSLGGLDLHFGDRLSSWLDIILDAPAMSEVHINRVKLNLGSST